MEEKTRRVYCDLLINEIVEMFQISYEDATYAVEHSAIQQLMDEMPEYVDTVPLDSWAKDVYNEYIK
jgi:hypothetical protein